MMNSYFVLVSLAAMFTGIVCEDVPCNKRSAPFGFVCVCNSSYCDTITRPSPLPRGHYYHYTTSQNSPGFSRTTGSFANLPYQDENNTAVFTVNRTIQYQEIIGFGGSFTDAAGMAISSLPEVVQDKLFESYFSPNGSEYTLGRVPIGGSDFSTRAYTYDDVPGDEDLTHFSLAEEDYKFKIPIMHRAINLSSYEFKLIGSTFSAPSWMKTDNSSLSATIKTKYLPTYAKYHIKFLDAYAKEGIKYWLLTSGNEIVLPLMFQTQFPFGMIIWPVPQRNWVRHHLGPLLKASNHSDVRFAILDDQRNFAKYWMDRFAADPEVFDLVEGIALHWYWDFLCPVSVLDDIHRKYPDKLILYTEASIITVIFGGKTVELGSWHRGALFASNIIENLNHWVSTFIDWNLALDTEGGPTMFLPTDCSIIINATSGEFYKNPMYYALAHFSKFIPPGSRRVDVKSNLNETLNTVKSPFNLEDMARLYKQKNQQSPVLEDTAESSSNTEAPLPTFPPFPPFHIPKTIFHLATANSDNSFTVILLNTQDVLASVTIVDETLGSISTTLAPQSINTFVYWPNS